MLEKNLAWSKKKVKDEECYIDDQLEPFPIIQYIRKLSFCQLLGTIPNISAKYLVANQLEPFLICISAKYLVANQLEPFLIY